MECSKKRPRNFDKDYETSISSSVGKSIITTTSTLTSKKSEKYVTQSKKNSEGGRARERSTLVSWLIRNRVLSPGTKVTCRGRNNIVKRGRLSYDGIVCDCCNVIFPITKFEAHADCTRHRPSTSILLDDGRSLLKCQKDALSLRDQRDQNKNHFVVEENVEANNDSVCLVCGLGGDIILCDRCPSSFHISCLGLDHVPEDDWFCSTCCCKVCRRPKCKQECKDHMDNNVLVCAQCAQRYHFGCLKFIDFGLWYVESNKKKKDWFCSLVCGNIFLDLMKLLGKPIEVADNITWTLVKNVSSDIDDDNGDIGGGFTSNKLIAALSLLYESFNPTIDVLSGRDLIKDLIFSRESKNNRLNFSGFFTVILEINCEVITVATIRIYGQNVAEIVFVATKEQYRGRGMCRLLLNELEKQLIVLGVGSLILHSSEDAINTWTKSFGFVRITPREKRQFIDYTFLEFENTIMCLKSLK
ncbi:increased DNA methylation 1-like [Vicia villosa]|uniref:increased DNA methylation 1-like n=1 Tax=Vicia villosa TaxID=3911 RepID=UPI00273B8D0B|nr:increased DNA methylation 1-like [Vicia villosa]